MRTLYDPEKDPIVMNDVYDDPADAEVVRRLKTELEDLREKYEDDNTAPLLDCSPRF